MAVNYIAPFLLTLALLPWLKKSSDPRVVTVSSIAHQSGLIDFDNLNSERHFDAYQAYANSKLADMLFAGELARRETWLSSNSLHPGVIDTKLLHAGFSMTGASVVDGARTPVYLATSPAVRGVSGKYFDQCRAVPASPLLADRQLGSALWRWTENAVRPYLALATNGNKYGQPNVAEQRKEPS
jgi:NAD(P)-dependent dehydrogenase (short-subunit alcohol dehydrogenase family)